MVTRLRLPRLPVNWQTQPELFKRYWDEAMTNIEKNIDALNGVTTVSNNTRSEDSLVRSYITNFTAPLIQANSVGLVTIATHDRVYADAALNPTVTVTGGSISTGATSGQIVRVYYDQASRAGGTVTYQFTVDPATPPVQGGIRHSVGVVVIPASGSQGGGSIQPPGYVEP